MTLEQRLQHELRERGLDADRSWELYQFLLVRATLGITDVGNIRAMLRRHGYSKAYADAAIAAMEGGQ